MYGTKYLIELLKARDLTKLVKKRIVNKKGHSQTVYVRQSKADEMSKKVKKRHKDAGMTDPADFADPDNAKYPIKTKQHTRSAMAYFARHNQKYQPAKRMQIARRIVNAAKKHGLNVSDTWKEKVGYEKKGIDQKAAFEKLARSNKWFKNRGCHVRGIVDKNGIMHVGVTQEGKKMRRKSIQKGDIANIADLIKQAKAYVTSEINKQSAKQSAKEKPQMKIAKADSNVNGLFSREDMSILE